MYKLIVSIGRFEIVYAVMDENKNIKELKIEMVADSTDQIVYFSSKTFVVKVLDAIKLIIHDKQIEEVTFILPTQDILLSFKKPPTHDELITGLLKSEDIDAEGAEMVIGKPIIYKKSTIIPISLYDPILDTFMKELLLRKDIINGDAVINYTAPISTMINIGQRLPGKTAIMDSSYFKTRILICEQGIPTDYAEFALSGRSILYNMMKSGIDVTDALSILHSSKGPRLTEVQEELKTNLPEINKFLKRHAPDSVYMYGGLSNLPLEKQLAIPTQRVAVNDRNIEEINSKIAYKLVPIFFHGNDLLNNYNIQRLEVLRNTPYSPLSDLTVTPESQVEEYINNLIYSSQAYTPTEELEELPDNPTPNPTTNPAPNPTPNPTPKLTYTLITDLPDFNTPISEPETIIITPNPPEPEPTPEPEPEPEPAPPKTKSAPRKLRLADYKDLQNYIFVGVPKPPPTQPTQPVQPVPPPTQPAPPPPPEPIPQPPTLDEILDNMTEEELRAYEQQLIADCEAVKERVDEIEHNLQVTKINLDDENADLPKISPEDQKILDKNKKLSNKFYKTKNSKVSSLGLIPLILIAMFSTLLVIKVMHDFGYINEPAMVYFGSYTEQEIDKINKIKAYVQTINGRAAAQAKIPLRKVSYSIKGNKVQAVVRNIPKTEEGKIYLDTYKLLYLSLETPEVKPRTPQGLLIKLQDRNEIQHLIISVDYQ